MTEILITGATGTIGGEIFRLLHARQIPVRLLVRDPARAPQPCGDCEIVVSDFADHGRLEGALSGIQAVFLASYDRPEVCANQANALAAAARCGVRRIVRMSTMGIERYAHLPIFDWHRRGERQLEDSGLDFTHLRPSWVMQNFLSMVVDDSIRLPAGEGRVAFVDARDVAAVAAEALTGDGHEGKAYELTGPELLSHREVAAKLSAATGRSISYVDIPPALYDAEKTAGGWPRSSIDTMLGLFADIRAGTNHDRVLTDGVTGITGRVPICFDDFARDCASCIGRGD